MLKCSESTKSTGRFCEAALIKIVPVNIEELMSPIVLAHLIMGDGNIKLPDKIILYYGGPYLRLGAGPPFSKEEVERLALAITNGGCF